MTDSGISIKINNDVISALQKAIKDPSDLMALIGDRFVELSRACITKGTDSQGRPFKPLHPLTLLSKRGNRILFQSGGGYDSIHKTMKGGRSVEIGSNLPYMKAEQLGMRILPKGNYLCIPLSFEAAQVVHGAGGATQGGKIRGIEGLFPITVHGHKFLVKHAKQQIAGGYASIGGRHGATNIDYLEYWYMLVKFVDIPKREFLPTGDINSYPLFKKQIQNTIAGYLKKVKEQASFWSQIPYDFQENKS